MKAVVDQAERFKAIDPRESFIVSAPAGSGKTGLITQRILGLLATVDEPEEILSITFCKGNQESLSIENQKNSSDTLINGSKDKEWKEYKMVYARFNQENRIRTFYSEKAYEACSN